MASKRWEKQVEEAIDGYQWNGRKRKSPVALRLIAAKLLARQHRALVRMVKQHKIENPSTSTGIGYNLAVENILDALKGARR